LSIQSKLMCVWARAEQKARDGDIRFD
jgi:hypothetical protein